MEKQEVGIDNPVEVAGVTLIPVVKVSLNYWYANGGISSFGVKQAVAVVVLHPTAKRAFRITGEEVIAVGDGEIDNCMLKRAGLGVAFNASEKVQQHADISTSDMSSILNYI